MQLFLVQFAEHNPIKPILNVQETIFIAEVDKLNREQEVLIM